MEHKFQDLDLFGPYDLSEDRINKRIKYYLQDTPAGDARKDILKQLISFIDLTTLEGADNADKIRSLVEKARINERYESLDNVAAICVYPSLVRIARKELGDTGIKLASVAAGFPSGQISVNIKIEEIRYAIEEGADELDVVISRGKLLEGNEQEVFEELCLMKQAAGGRHLKVILETGELKTINMIRKASILSLLAGADFIKTSTGKIAVGATETAFVVMADSAKEYYNITGRRVGIKAAGGIRTPDQALKYYQLLKNILGEEWLTPDLFRIGASSLLDVILDYIQ